jgi:Tol biopolymer transport system component
VESGRVRELRLPLLYINEPRWLPDSRSLVVFGRNFKGHGAIHRIDAETGKTSVIADADLCRVQVSPDGKKIYYEVGRVTLGSGPRRLFEHNLSSASAGELLTLPDGGGSVELSPDGRLLALVVLDPKTKTTTLTVRPVDGGEPRALFHVDHPDRLQHFGGMSWTPDSQGLVVVNTTGDRFQPKDLWLVPVTGDKARKLDIDIRGWNLVGIRLHPDGRQIAFFSGQDLREVWALENVFQVTLTR